MTATRLCHRVPSRAVVVRPGRNAFLLITGGMTRVVRQKVVWGGLVLIGLVAVWRHHRNTVSERRIAKT